MLNPPPFKFATTAIAAIGAGAAGRSESDHPCCGDAEAMDDVRAHGRPRLADLDPHLHCSLLGTCIGTAELRKLMARFIDVHGASDLEVHHEAVRLASVDTRVSKALHKALDKRHDAAVQRYARTRDTRELETLWNESLRLGEVPGAYWALLTHRHVSPELRQKAFGDVHMLSHLVGAANRADIRRLVALEKDNADLHERLEREQTRSQQLLVERDTALAQLQQLRVADDAARQALADAPRSPDPDTDALASVVAVQTARREQAEGEASAMATEAQRLREELEHLRRHAQELGSELAAAELQLRERGDEADVDGQAHPLARHLKDRRILYVGGRPSSTPAIRDLVHRHGGEFQKHDGGFEDRKGLLESSVAWAELVLFPVDCVDHDSAGRLKRLCGKLGTPFVPLRSAGVASFASAIVGIDDTRSPRAAQSRPPICLRNA